MIIGPVFFREAVVAPRRVRHYFMRSIYAIALLLLICTAWMILTGTQYIQNVGDMARFGSVLFQILAPLQLALILFLSALQAASNIAIEKDRQTLILLLLSRLTNSELVLGKLLASLLNIGVMLIAALPIFMMVVLFGGTSFAQVGWTFAVTGLTAFAAGSLGATVALWREKTFQALALVAMAIVFWLGISEVIGFSDLEIAGVKGSQIANATSPFRAVIAASQPTVMTTWPTMVAPFLVVAATIAVLLCCISILRVRRWNPNRDVRIGQSSEEDEVKVDIFTGDVIHESEGSEPKSTSRADGREVVQRSEGLRAGHVDDRNRTANKSSRRVWDNPVLWREVMTWAYGRKILFIRAAYWILAA